MSLGHIPPSYSPIARQRVGIHRNDVHGTLPQLYDIDPALTGAAAAKIEAPVESWDFVTYMSPYLTVSSVDSLHFHLLHLFYEVCV